VKVVILATVLASMASAPVPMPAGGAVRVLYYGPGSFARVLRCHMSRGCGDGGDYAPGLRVLPGTDGLTAVNFASRWMVRANTVVVASLYDPVRRVWVTQRLQAADWQRPADATRVQRLEVDYATAARLHFVGRNTIARILRYEVYGTGYGSGAGK
jgi:hypothetical protein